MLHKSMLDLKWLESQGKFLNDDKMEPRLTIAYSYYEEPELLEKQAQLWEDYPPGVEIFVVDDGSQKYPALDILKRTYFPYGPNIQLWTVDEDLGFNSHGCRNLAATYAPTDPILFLDMDITLNPCDVGSLRRIAFKDGRHYMFNAYIRHKKTFVPCPGHINMFITTKKTYWDAGGYDESFTGWHYGDREFHERLEAASTKNNTGITLTIERGGREMYVDPDQESRMVYDNTNMKLIYRDELPDFNILKGTQPNKLVFPYTRIL